MGAMRTRLPSHLAVLIAILTGLAVLAPAAAWAQTVQLGQTTTPVIAPSCPTGVTLNGCKIVLARTTALQLSSDSVLNPTRVNQEGWVVAFTVGLSRLVANPAKRASIIKGLDSEFGGPPELALTVLAPGPKNTYTVAAESPTFQVTPFLGQVLEQPMSLPPRFSSFTALHVLRGDVIGLTVPTWAPVLALDLPGTQFSYRQSRRANCNNAAATETAQTKVGVTGGYGCYYSGTRVEYSATEITDTKAPKTYVGDVSARAR
jgi:hypothetical protein